jgi:HprK-related kinase A
METLGREDVLARLRNDGLAISMGPFVASVRSDIPDVGVQIAGMYVNHRIVLSAEFSDFHVEITRPRGLRRWARQQAVFFLDGETPFRPLPIRQAFPMLEWGLNWCISNFAHQFLIVHAAVVERNGLAVMMPGQPGSGKSTLCAALVSRGWRLLSDELALICRKTRRLVPLARPINLKNESIGVIKAFAPDAVLTPDFEDTSKGTVALMRPPSDSVERDRESAPLGWMISPKFEVGLGCELSEETRGRALMHLADSSFNYSLLGEEGFELAASLAESVPGFRLLYGDMARAVEELDRLVSCGSG